MSSQDVELDQTKTPAWQVFFKEERGIIMDDK